MDPVTSEILKAWGAAGAIIIALGLTVIKLYSRVGVMQDSVVALQEKRISEHQANTERMLTGLNASTDAQKATAATLATLPAVVAAALKGGKR